jgi:threonine/homoserine/homoserine lactone efflux protein
VVLLLIPGPAVLHVVARSVDHGRRAGLASSAGIATGHTFWPQRLGSQPCWSPVWSPRQRAYSVVKYADAAYLFYLGIKKFRERPAADDEVQHMQTLPLSLVYAQGVLVNVLNPKTAIFFFAFLPPFVNPGPGHVSLQFLAMGMLSAVMGFTSDSIWAFTAGSAVGWMRRNQTFLRNQHCVSGTVYLGLGMATAVTGSRHT